MLSKKENRRRKNTADLMVECLENEGVELIFGVPGEENEDLLFAIERSEKITFVPCRHEQGAAFIANVWGRLSGEAGVCLATLGPGATNLVTGLADANLDKAPVVAITGQGDISRLHHESHQLIDIVKLFEPITKWNSAVKSPEVVPEIIRKAFKIAESAKSGVTHIELSEDIAGERVKQSIKPLKITPDYTPDANVHSINTAFDLLKDAKYPLVMIGNGAVRNDLFLDLEKLFKVTGLPVVSTFMGKGAVSDRMLNSLMVVGLGFKDFVMEAMEKADLVLTIGYDIAEYSPDTWNPKNNKTIIHIDEAPAEVYNTYLPDIELVGHIKSILEKFSKKIFIEKYVNPDLSWYIPIRDRILKDIKSYDLKENQNFNVPGVLNILREYMPDNGIAISDVGAHKMWIARNFPTYSCNTSIISNGMASMGIALPGGIAASLLFEDRPVVSLMGDGGFMMNLQELETAKRLGCGYTIIVFNDNDYGLISWKQKRTHSHATGTKLTNPDFVKLARSFGIKAVRPKHKKELISVLKRSLNNKELTLIEIPINPDVNQGLVEKLNDYWDKQKDKKMKPHRKPGLAKVGRPVPRASKTRKKVGVKTS